MEETKFLSVNQLAETFGISRRTVYREIERGIPHMRVGQRIRFDYKEALHWFRTKK